MAAPDEIELHPDDEQEARRRADRIEPVILVRPSKAADGLPRWAAKWRATAALPNMKDRQILRNIGPAWLSPVQGDPLPISKDQAAWEAKWTKKSGRPKDGALTEKALGARVAAEVLFVERQILAAERDAPDPDSYTFDDAAKSWLRHLRTVKKIKPSTMNNYLSLLRTPEKDEPENRGRIMRAFGGRELREITHDDVRKFIEKLDDDESVGARTTNVARQTLSSIFDRAVKERKLRRNPVDGIEKRAENRPAEIVVYTPEQIEALARVAREGRHRKVRVKTAEHEDADAVAHRQLEDETDAALILFLGFTGARLGEALALRWRHVLWGSEKVNISRSYSGGRETEPKSGKSRPVPMAHQVFVVLDSLSKREHFTDQNDLVFTTTGTYMDRSAIGRRYRNCRDIVCAEDDQMPVLRLHDLRHTFGSLAAERFTLVDIQAMLGHSDVRTTGRYLHARPGAEDAAKLTEIFGGKPKEATPTAETVEG